MVELLRMMLLCLSPAIKSIPTFISLIIWSWQFLNDLDSVLHYHLEPKFIVKAIDAHRWDFSNLNSFVRFFSWVPFRRLLIEEFACFHFFIHYFIEHILRRESFCSHVLTHNFTFSVIASEESQWDESRRSDVSKQFQIVSLNQVSLLLALFHV